MSELETCVIRIEMNEAIRPDFSPDLEDTVKQAWSHLTPWFTRRHGVREGEIILNGGAVKFSWKYEIEDSPHE